MNYMKLKEWKEKNKWKDLIYKTNKYKKYKQINIFNNMKLIKSFDGSIYVGKITTDEAEEDQSNLLKI